MLFLFDINYNMGNKLFTTPPNDCCGPEITNDEIKNLTFIGFTKEELDSFYLDEEKTKNKKGENKKSIKR